MKWGSSIIINDVVDDRPDRPGQPVALYPGKPEWTFIRPALQKIVKNLFKAVKCSIENWKQHASTRNGARNEEHETTHTIDQVLLLYLVVRG